jgi:hypothetical protein
VVKDMQNAWLAGKKPSFLSLLIANKEAQAMDPHDKIYAFWALSKDAAKLLREPDYSNSAKELYTTLVIEWIDYYRSVDIICASQWRLTGSKGADGLRMWVPDVGSLISLFLLSALKRIFHILKISSPQRNSFPYMSQEDHSKGNVLTAQLVECNLAH